MGHCYQNIESKFSDLKVIINYNYSSQWKEHQCISAEHFSGMQKVMNSIPKSQEHKRFLVHVVAYIYNPSI